jgi:serine/threonine protein kinase
METLGPDGRYELRSQIVKGARSTVHQALDRQRRVPVIVKRFTAAAHVAEYASIVAAVQLADIPGLLLPQELALTPAPFAVYPAIAGEPLESALRSGAVQWARAAELVSSLAATLAAVARATGHTHRNLKPGNVWLTQDGAPRILDLGGAALGPPGPVRRGADLLEYRAPEQLDGSPGDARTDVFTLAVLLVELTTGVHPFVGATPFQAAHRLTRTPPDLAELTRGMTSTSAREVAALVARALASNPDERPPDPAAFAAKLDYLRTLVGAPAPPRPARPPAPERPPEPVRPVADPTTIMQLPLMHRAAPKPPAEPTPGAPAPLADPAPRFARHAPQASPGPANDPPPALEHVTHELHRPVPADSPSPPLVDPEPATHVLPRTTGRIPPNRPLAQTSLADRTERDIQPRDDDATRALPRIARARPPAPTDDELTTVALPRIARRPAPDPAESTLQLPDAPAGPAASDTLVLPDAPDRPDTSATRALADTPPQPALAVSPRISGLLIGLNVLCVVALVLLVIAML